MTGGALSLLCLVTLSLSAQQTDPGPREDRAAGRSLAPEDHAAARPGSPGSQHRVSAGNDDFERGRALFTRDFHKSSGLGSPDINADSCRACHRDPTIGGAGGLELNVSRFARDNGGAGPFEDLPGGQTLSKLRPPYESGREEYETSEADVFEQRQTPSLLGDGRIEGIPDSAILANEDPTDRDGDGIRGVARRRSLAGPAGATVEIGRFGWKAQVPRLADFVRDALGGELGLTSPDDGRGFALASDVDAHPDPEIDEVSVGYIAFFLSELPAPPRVGSLDPEVLRGEVLFTEIGCAKCHVSELEGSDGPVPLYSDLLLHEVWPAGFRGMSEPGAPSGVYRTPPLWGIRATAPYLHDGRASTLRAAILAHDGEARTVRANFESLSADAKSALLAFLDDL